MTDLEALGVVIAFIGLCGARMFFDEFMNFDGRFACCVGFLLSCGAAWAGLHMAHVIH